MKDLTRADTLQLHEFFEKLRHQILEPNLRSTAWRFLPNNSNRISAKLPGRVVHLQP